MLERSDEIYLSFPLVEGTKEYKVYQRTWRNSIVAVPNETFTAIGITAAIVRADCLYLQAKHPDQFATPEEVQAHLAYVLAAPTDILPASKAEFKLLIRRNGTDKAVVLDVQMRQGKYKVASAYTLDAGQLEVKRRRVKSQLEGRPSSGPASPRYGSAASPEGDANSSRFSSQGAVVPSNTSSTGNTIIPDKDVKE